MSLGQRADQGSIGLSLKWVSADNGASTTALSESNRQAQNGSRSIGRSQILAVNEMISDLSLQRCRHVQLNPLLVHDDPPRQAKRIGHRWNKPDNCCAQHVLECSRRYTLWRWRFADPGIFRAIGRAGGDDGRIGGE